MTTGQTQGETWNEAARGTARGQNSRKPGGLAVRLMPLVFAAVLIGAVAGGLWNAANAVSGAAPASLGSLRLTETIVGAEAVAEMSKLHGKDVGLVDGYVAHYDGSSGGAVLYVGETVSEKSATELLRQMEVRIAAGNQYFTGLKPLTVEGVHLFFVRAGPQSHYFWQAGKKVLWIGLDRDDQAALAAAVNAFR